MLHSLDWSKPSRLVRSPNAVQFGDGYRQVTGPTIASGTARDMLDHLRAMPAADIHQVYLCQDAANPMSLAEVEAQVVREG